MKIVKVLGYAAGVLVGLVAIASAGVYLSSSSKLHRTYAVPVRPFAIPTDAEALARGEHLARTRGCVDCHGTDFGGTKIIADGAMGKIYGPNLTRAAGTRVAHFKDEDWIRAIRHGVAADGYGLLLMPSEEYSHLSDDDLGSLIAFLRVLPPVERADGPIQPGPVTRVLLATGKMKLAVTQIDHAHINPAAVEKAPTPEYGRYLANACVGCHRSDFSGGKIEIGPPDWPPARNLTAAGDLARWTEADFVRAIREGRRPDGAEISTVMPRGFAGLDDTELRALYTFLKTLPAVPTRSK
jgi:cytochrome c553